MILQCCCICHEDALAAMRGGMEQFTAQTGVKLETEWFSGPSDLYQRIAASPCQAVVVALPGAAGMEAATRTREILSDVPLVWCSDDRDFAIHSYRLNAAAFLELPVTEAQVADALSRRLLKEKRKRGR